MQPSICAEMIYASLPFVERVARIRQAGFEAYEFWAWTDKDLAALNRCELAVATFSGQRQGSLVDPADLERYARQVREAAAVARRLGCGGLMILTDELSADGSVQTPYPPLTAGERRGNIVAGLRQLAPVAEELGVTLYLEPLNTLVDHRGYSLASSAEGFAIVEAVGSARIKLLFDIYHMQIMEGNIIASLSANLELVGHVHAADVPGRHEPGTGELNYRRILGALGELGYDGFVGFELSPAGDDARALASIRALWDDL